MPKCFPKLTQNRVRLDLGDGKSVSVRMLPVERMGEFKQCTEDLRNVSTQEGLDAVRNRLAALAREVIPPPYADNLERFPLDALAELTAYLMYGEGNDGDDQPKADSEEADVPAKN